jgi:tRNA nucleotidyltransferase (CCA-adding enzyme)
MAALPAMQEWRRAHWPEKATERNAASAMQIFTVGGAVRDELLGLPVQDRDYVVVGASPEEMLARGFKPVGKDFPVFLHPKTHEEYAWPAPSASPGTATRAFPFTRRPEVTLEEDLARRDLTINAIARADDGTLIDPFNGVADIGRACCATSARPSSKTRCASCASRALPRASPISPSRPKRLALMRQMVAAAKSIIWCRTRLAGTGQGADGSQTVAHDRRAARMRRAGAPAARARPPVRRAAAGRLPPGNRYRRACHDGARPVGQAGFALPVRFAVLLHDLGKG